MTDNVRALNPSSNDWQTELGVSAPQRVAATLYDDFLPELRGQRALRTWREMAANDATVSSILFAITMLAREIDWTVEPGDESSQAAQSAEWLEGQVAGLAHPLSDTIGEAFTALTYGFSFHETGYRLDDGVAWDRFPYRPQDTLVRWELDDKLRPTAFVQSASHGSPVVIPTVKGILFRTDTSTPSGTPLIRGAYRSWMLKKRSEEQLMIGMSRNLQGMPMIKVPSHVLLAGPGNAEYEAFKKMVTRVKRDEQMGMLMPSDRDVNGELLYEFELVTPDGNPNFDQIVAVIRMFAADITATVLAQFVGLGRDAVGSRALAEPQQAMFQVALGAMLDMLQDVFNRQAVTQLYDLNPSQTGPRARLVHGEVKNVDLTGLAELLLKTSQAGASWFTGEDDDPLLARIKNMAGLHDQAG